MRLLALDDHVHVRAGDARVGLARDLEAPAGEPERAERALERGPVEPRVEGGREEHVAGDPADGLEDD